MENRAYQESDGTPAEGLSFAQRMKSGVSTAVGAVAALGIVFALGVWFYRLGDRDARSVPIIRAEVGPTKKIPDDPGGEKTPHQGIKSYEAANGNTATAGAAVIAAAPPEPKPEDVPMGKLAPPVKPAAGGSGADTAKTAERGTGERETGERETSDAAPATAVAAPERAGHGPKRMKAPTHGDGEKLAAAPDAATVAPERPEAETTVTETGTGTPEADADAVPDATTVPDEELVIPGATENAPDQSPFAPRRPGNLIDRHKAAAVTAVEEKKDLAAEAAASAVQIQLVADPDRETVIRLWRKVYRENVDILQGRALALQTTVSGGVTWYRLRVGPFKSRAEAASVCQALKARDQDCIVSRNS